MCVRVLRGCEATLHQNSKTGNDKPPPKELFLFTTLVSKKIDVV